MLFDTHAHLDDAAFDTDRAALLDTLPTQGIALLMNPACSAASSRQVCRMAAEIPWLYGAVGSHPDAAGEVTEELIGQYRRMVQENGKIKAIGEIGLDHHYEDVPRDVQRRAFEMQMALAAELSLPVIVHDRETHGEAMAVVEQFPTVQGVFHCYSGSVEMAQWLIERGWYIGFTGVLTFKNARKALLVAADIPLERIVLETDCPYMAPEPFRGKRNTPAYLYRMAQQLAQVRGLAVEDVERITLENGKRLYRI